LPPPLHQDHFYIYGELGLSGDVFEPEDLASDFEGAEKTQVLTGALSSVCCPFARRVIHELKELAQPRFHAAEMKLIPIQRPKEGLSLFYNEVHAEILSLAALGGHSLLLAGPAGSGKTTMAKALGSFLSEPRPEEILEIKKINKDLTYEDSLWRPIIHPHHSSTPLALVGGGVPPKPGEISRSHRGVLILDELLEFDPKVQESLREPMEEGSLRLTRGTSAIRYPAAAQVVATTNLCPCGDFTPGGRASCRFSLIRCKSYSYRLSGPMVDRFELLYFTERQRNPLLNTVSGEEILQKLERSREWMKAQNRGWVLNSRRPAVDIEKEVVRFYFEHLMNKDLGSHRRYQATLRVARTFADLDCDPLIQEAHLEKALNWTSRPFELLKRWD
jgi:magnesium chelatase family protein